MLVDTVGLFCVFGIRLGSWLSMFFLLTKIMKYFNNIFHCVLEHMARVDNCFFINLSSRLQYALGPK